MNVDARHGHDGCCLFQFVRQRHQLVPMLHGSLLTSADECVDSCMVEGCRAITGGVHTDGNIGDGEIVVVLVLTVHIDNLREHRCR